MLYITYHTIYLNELFYVTGIKKIGLFTSKTMLFTLKELQVLKFENRR